MLSTSFKVDHGLLMPLTILPSHVNEFILIREHVSLVVLLDLEKHFVLMHPVEGTLKNSLFVSVHLYGWLALRPSWLALMSGKLI